MSGAGEGGLQPHLTPFLDADLEDVVARMRQQQLATDQRNIAEKALEGRTLSCRQGGEILQIVTLGIMQRKLALEVLRGRLSDLPEGLPDLVAPLEGEIRNDVTRVFSDASTHALSQGRSTGSRSFSPNFRGPTTAMTELATKVRSGGDDRGAGKLTGQQLPEGTAWREPLDRLRKDVCNSAQVPDRVYDDVGAVFEALGLAPLPPRQGGSGNYANSQAAQPPGGASDAEYVEQLLQAQDEFDNDEMGSKASEESC